MHRICDTGCGDRSRQWISFLGTRCIASYLVFSGTLCVYMFSDPGIDQSWLPHFLPCLWGRANGPPHNHRFIYRYAIFPATTMSSGRLKATFRSFHLQLDASPHPIQATNLSGRPTPRMVCCRWIGGQHPLPDSTPHCLTFTSKA